MTDTYFDESVPPHLFAPVDPFSTPGDKSADFTAAYGVDPSTFADRTVLKSDPTFGDSVWTADPWHNSAYIELGDGDWVSWSGTTWIDGPAPDPPPPPPPPFDPADYTVDDVKAYVNGLADAGNNHPETQRVLDAERAGMNRSTLVDWLDQKTGAV